MFPYHQPLFFNCFFNDIPIDDTKVIVILCTDDGQYTKLHFTTENTVVIYVLSYLDFGGGIRRGASSAVWFDEGW